MMQYACCAGPLGQIVIGWEQDAVVSIKLSKDYKGENVASAVSDLAAAQLQEYLTGSRKQLDFPLSPRGTAFQMTVWRALMQIPYGQTRSYGEIAAMIGKPQASRAVGMACSRNPIWIAIPCHRIVGKNGNLTGYAGGVDIKQALLALERSHL